MKLVVAGWILPILQNYISEIVLDGKEGIITKWKHKQFLKNLNTAIVDFCNRNECLYIDSGAFEYFIRSTDFLKKIVERAVSTKIEESDKVFFTSWIEKAREIANAEAISFSPNEERLIRDLCNIIENQVRAYYNQKLSVEQKVIVAKHLREFAEMKETIVDGKNEIKKDNKTQTEIILNAIKDASVIGESKAELLSEILITSIWEGRIKEFENLASVVIDKSTDLKNLYECIKNTFIVDTNIDLTDSLGKITNTTIRDNVIRAVAPIRLLNHKTAERLSDYATSSSLKTIIDSIETGDWGKVFTQSISKKSGVEVHNFELNKKLVYEETRLVKQVATVYLYEQRAFNTSDAMMDLAKDVKTWLNRVLIDDRRIDSLLGSKNPDKAIDEVSAIAEELKKEESLYLGLTPDIKVIYVGIQAKVALISGKDIEADNIIPEELKNRRPLSDYVYSAKIEKHEIDLNELYEYCIANHTYWLLCNYFISRQNETELIDFCISHENVLSEDGHIFFMFLGALRAVNDNKKYMRFLDEYSKEYDGFYEFWNEKLLVDESDDSKSQFIEHCQEGKMLFVFRQSLYLLIERLLNYQKYDEAELYISKAELLGESDARLKKYRGIIEQGKGRQLEAIKHYYDAFKDNPKDAYVIDSIISLSFINKRKVKEEVLLAAEKIGTSRLHSLAAECYKREGNRAKAEEEIIKSILLTENDVYNPAFGQYVGFHTSSKTEGTRTIKGLDVDTVAYCISKDGITKCVCIYESQVLPASPWYWNGDYHIYTDDAASLGYIRKRKGDWIKIEDVDYQIKEIAPLDFYYFRTCMSKMTETGVAKEIAIPVKNGIMDMQAFTEQVKEFSPDEQEHRNWLEQYNNLEDVPLPLFAYKRFFRFNYLQFVDMIFSTNDIFIREIMCSSDTCEKYILSFTAIVMLYKIGFPSEKLKDSSVFISTSALEQVESDVTDIINDYDRDTVATMGVFDGQVFINETGDDGKDFWIKEAGNIKQYCRKIPTLDSNNDLRGEFFEGYDSKDLFGICDYDAISIANNSDEYALVSIEAILSSLHQNELVNINTTSLVDFLIGMKPDVEDFIEYLSKLMNYGCLMSISRNAIVYISDYVKHLDDARREMVYKAFDELLRNIDIYPDKIRTVAIQALTESFGKLQDVAADVDHIVFRIMIRNMLLFRKQKMQLFIDDKGDLTLALIDIKPKSEIAEVEEE